jgi:hypothetical protein
VPELAVSKLTAELPGAKPTVRDEPVVTVSTEDRSEADDGAERCVGSTWSQPSGAVHPSDDGRGPWCDSPREVLDLRAERSMVGSRESAGEDLEDQGTLRRPSWERLADRAEAGRVACESEVGGGGGGQPRLDIRALFPAPRPRLRREKGASRRRPSVELERDSKAGALEGRGSKGVSHRACQRARRLSL